jgi:CHASE2 domain-containing sensor protein
MKWASLLLFFLTLPLVFNAPPLEILRLKTFDALVETPDPTGYFTILNIDEEYLDKEGGYPLPRKTLADIHLKLVLVGLCCFPILIGSVVMKNLPTCSA